ncbi:MAG: Mov34/MPN/PAD-1 family protein [Candidatus Freyarchaeota archaeon]|nr:Mov34/MPN/PAD-1 family protein [Candidatus Jordarchaeia archaeon]
MKVIISPIALSKALYVALDNKGVEVAGFLVGRVEEDHVLVTDSLWMGSRGGDVRVELDFNVMAKVTEELERERGGEVIVGWWHSHPRMGADFMSATDVETQRVYQAFFPHAVALIVDPAEYEKSGVNERSCSLYKIVSDRYEAIPLETTLELNELISASVKFMKKALGRYAGGAVLTQKAMFCGKERLGKNGELFIITLSIWTIILVLLFWILS